MTPRGSSRDIRSDRVSLSLVCAGLTILIAAGCDTATHQIEPPPPQSVATPAARSVPVTDPPLEPVFEFAEIADSIGVRFQRNDDIRGLHRLLEANGGGVGVLDFDGDGRPDLFLTNGCPLPFVADSTDSNALFQNRGPEGFVDVAVAAGLNRSGYWQGCTCGDLDGDGFDDLYVAAFGNNALYLNQGDGTFREVTDSTGTAVGKWSSSPAMADLNLDGHIDLFVVTYVEADANHPRLCPEPASTDGYIQCSPTLFRATDDVLFLNDGQGRFVDGTREAGITGEDGKGLGIAIFDYDGDHRPDVFVANDGTPSFLYHALPVAQDPPTGTSRPVIPRFQECAFECGVAISREGRAQAGMGVSVADVDGDGWQDIHVTNFLGEPNSLYLSQSGTSFIDASAASGLGAPSRAVLGFGAEFLDADNDGWLDLFITNGHVDDLTSFTRIPYRMPPLVFRSRHDGTFEDVTRRTGPYGRGVWLGRGLATTDLDRDGKMDIVISHQRGPSAVLRNETHACGPSCRLRLVGTGSSNRSAFHSTILTEGLEGPPSRQIIGGGSFQSASDRTVHIGMGAAPVVPKLTVRWPNDQVESHENLAPGEYVLVQGRSPVLLSRAGGTR